MKILKCSKPKGFFNTNLYFPNQKSAEEYISYLNTEHLLKKAKSLELPISKRRKKNLFFSRPKNYVLTKVGSKFALWEKIK